MCGSAFDYYNEGIRRHPENLESAEEHSVEPGARQMTSNGKITRKPDGRLE